jgi:hypothetical protein
MEMKKVRILLLGKVALEVLMKGLRNSRTTFSYQVSQTDSISDQVVFSTIKKRWASITP